MDLKKSMNSSEIKKDRSVDDLLITFRYCYYQALLYQAFSWEYIRKVNVPMTGHLRILYQ